jgi:hypothetical protein
MFREEKIINGILHYRTSPNEEFKSYTLENLTDIVGTLKEEMPKQEGYTKEKVFEIERFRAIDFTKWFSDFNGLTWEEKRVTKERLDTLYEKYLGTLGGGI